MNAVLKLFLSMSFSGGLLILALFFGKRFLKDKISRQWQYYIWLVVILRLLLPFAPETNLLGKTYQAVDQALGGTVLLPPRQPVENTASESASAPAAGLDQNFESGRYPAEAVTAFHPLQDMETLLTAHIWLIWLAAALGLLIRKVTIYQSFMRYINAGSAPVSDIEMLDRLSEAAQQAGVQKPIELCVNPLISSPLLSGFFYPCIVLPDTELSEKDFRYIVLHELTHFKRRDMFYKWLVQITVCLHWFNPLVHLMSREITKACEFSCDEAVLTKTGGGNAQDYGKTLLDAMAAVGRYKEHLGAVTLSENKQLLKERLGAIMKFKEQSKSVKILTVLLTLCMILGSAFIGVYTIETAAGNSHTDSLAGKLPDITGRLSLSPDINSAAVNVSESADQKIWAESNSDIYANVFLEPEKYYEAGSLPMFQVAFSRLDEEAQEIWLDKIYTDKGIVFWGAAVGLLDEDCGLIRRYAEKTYKDDNIAFFSVLAMHMSQDALEQWMERALKDGNWAFQSVLFQALDQGAEFDALKEKQEKEWEEAYAAGYQAVGVTMDGKNYYYQGQLVNIFLDIHQSDKSFYTLNMNPKGTVNIKIVRNEKNEITGVAYMTEEEIAELFGSDEDPGV